MLVSVVVPVYFNAPSLSSLHERLTKVAAQLSGYNFEFIFVDDGSADNSFDVLKALTTQDARVKALRLVRNFGSNAAILAGLAHSQGDCAVVLAADLQDPPELIVEMISHWRQGVPVVLAARGDRHDPFSSRVMADIFNKLYRRFVFPNFPPRGFDFFLADRQVVRTLVRSAGPNVYLMGLLLWAGYKSVTITYTRAEREHGKSQWTFWKKFKYFLDAFIGFSYLPLRMASVTGTLIATLGFLYAVFLLFARIVWGFPVEGWTSMMVVLLIVSGTQLVMLGIVGEYLWRTLDEARARPLFLIDEAIGVEIIEAGISNRS